MRNTNFTIVVSFIALAFQKKKIHQLLKLLPLIHQYIPILYDGNDDET